MAGPVPQAAITGREREVLALLAQHQTNAAIADSLGVSIRTVESHVSSLIRKLRVRDRRSAARKAATVLASHRALSRSWPVPASSFIGRDVECAELVAMIDRQRLVCVTGPGGVGKTRLATEVAALTTARRRDGGWFVDLVPVTDPTLVVSAIAQTLGVPEQQGRSRLDGVVAELGPSDGLLVLDNCEHLLDAVRGCVDRLLPSCPTLTILATSRTRLGTPAEWVLPVVGLPVGDGSGDAQKLFTARASAASGGHPPSGPDVTEVCRLLDGLPLAIELAAARFPTLGLDGIRAGFEDGLRALTAGRRDSGRHHSMRAAIAWSHDLLDPDEGALLCALTPFASWFDADAASYVAGPTAPIGIADALARLADSSLLVAAPGRPTRYRALELIRQFGAEQLAAQGISDTVHERHLHWCAGRLARLFPAPPDEAWCLEFDAVLPEARAAVGWAARSGSEALPSLAEAFAAQLLLRGMLAESQVCFEQAAATSPPGPDRCRLLRLAAGAAAARMVGNDTLRLLAAAARDALARDDGPAAAQDLAWMSIYTGQSPGIMVAVPTEAEDRKTLTAAATHAHGSAAAQAAVATARASRLTPGGPGADRVVQKAVLLAGASGQPLLESAALDQHTADRLARHDYAGALEALSRRGEVLDRVQLDATSAFQVNDFLLMASEAQLAVGDLPSAARFADRLAALPCYRQQDHLGLGRRIKVEALAGDLEAAADSGERFRVAWERAGRPVASNLGPSTYAVAMVYGLLGDDERRSGWVELTRSLVAHRPTQRLESNLSGWAATMDALLDLDRGRADLALDRLAADVDAALWDTWNAALWRPWYAALWTEAAVLGHHPEAQLRLVRSRPAAAVNPIAVAIIDRAAELFHGVADSRTLTHRARVFASLGCPYQERRTHQLRDRHSGRFDPV